MHIYFNWVNTKKCDCWIMSICSFVTNCQTLPKWLYHFSFLPAMKDSSYCSTSSSAFDAVRVLGFGHIIGMQWHLIVLICNSLMTYDVEHLFQCLLVICISSLVKCLLRSLAHALMRLFSYWVSRVLYIFLYNSSLSDVSFANISSHPASGPGLDFLILLTLSFFTAEGFHFIEV